MIWEEREGIDEELWEKGGVGRCFESRWRQRPSHQPRPQLSSSISSSSTVLSLRLVSLILCFCEIFLHYKSQSSSVSSSLVGAPISELNMARKKIREYDSKRLLKEHLKRLVGIDLQICSAQVSALFFFHSWIRVFFCLFLWCQHNFIEILRFLLSDLCLVAENNDRN